MTIALINPNWNFDGSIYFGCREPQLPIELGFAAEKLRSAGYPVCLIDAHLFDLSLGDIRAELTAADVELTVITTAPTYLFWRCAQPELRVPQELVRGLRDLVPKLVAVGPHGSTTPRATLRKLSVDVVVMGECEDVILRIARGDTDVPGTCIRDRDDIRISGRPQALLFSDAPPLSWPVEMVQRHHHHHHHRFDAASVGPGAEVEASRGCPYSCTFCAKLDFRDAYRRRPTPTVIEEIDRLIAHGVTYIYFIDEIFLPNAELLRALIERPVTFGVQTRIDLWKPDAIELLGRAGCVSVEAGIESLTPSGRDALAKRCKLDNDELAARLIEARRHIPFVQANLIKVPEDDPDEAVRWRERMREFGIWANDPVPLFPYPGSPDYRQRWGEPDDQAWERAVEHYLSQFVDFSDIQEERPRALADLEYGSTS